MTMIMQQYQQTAALQAMLYGYMPSTSAANSTANVASIAAMAAAAQAAQAQASTPTSKQVTLRVSSIRNSFLCYPDRQLVHSIHFHRCRCCCRSSPSASPSTSRRNGRNESDATSGSAPESSNLPVDGNQFISRPGGPNRPPRPGLSRTTTTTTTIAASGQEIETPVTLPYRLKVLNSTPVLLNFPHQKLHHIDPIVSSNYPSETISSIRSPVIISQFL